MIIMSTSGDCDTVEIITDKHNSSDNILITEKVEQALQTRIVSEDIVENNPILAR